MGLDELEQFGLLEQKIESLISLIIDKNSLFGEGVYEKLDLCVKPNSTSWCCGCDLRVEIEG